MDPICQQDDVVSPTKKDKKKIRNLKTIIFLISNVLIKKDEKTQVPRDCKIWQQK
jgi:hypothetical protein